MFLCDLEKEKEMMEIARQALLREQNGNKQKVNVLNEVMEKLDDYDFGKAFYEPYLDVHFENKVAIDLLYYRYLLRNLDETYNKDVQELIAQTYRTIKNIYEFVNIKPTVFGKDVDERLLECSIDVLEKKLSTILNETLDNIFYGLPAQKRADKYSSKVIPMSRKLISENNDPDDSLKFSVKSCVMEELLTKISFPGANWLRVKYLTESTDFGLIFDQQKLVELVETFEKQIGRMSKYLAACV